MNMKYTTQVTAENFGSASKAFLSLAEKFYYEGLSEDEMRRLCFLGGELHQYFLMERENAATQPKEKSKFSLKHLLHGEREEKATLQEVCEVMVDVLDSSLEYDEEKLKQMSKQELIGVEYNAHTVVGLCTELLQELGEVNMSSSVGSIKQHNAYTMHMARCQELIEKINKLFDGGDPAKQPGNGENT